MRAGQKNNRARKVVVESSTNGKLIEQGRIRLLCVGLFFLLCFGSISLRLVEMMITAYNAAPALASGSENADPEEQDVKAAASTLRRGDIVDRNGVLVATSLMTESAFANPRDIRNPAEAAQKLEKIVGISKEVLLKRINGGKSFVWIKRQLSPSQQQAVNNLGIPGIYFLPEEQRVYPYGALTSHVVGYVGVDNKGLAGIEKTYDHQLLDEDLARQPLALSMDIRIQHILRDEIRRAVDDFRALGGAGVILDANSGEVVAMVSLPDFDPHRPARARDEQKFNRVALGTYEMGSTFKSFTMALALDSGTATLKDGYDATNPLKLANFTITDQHPKKRWLSLPEIYAYSSNIGTARTLLDVGIKRQRQFMEKMGMLRPVETELPEKAQPLYPKDWKEISAITISYGHGISVTPLHLARGIAALVNGGTLPSLTLLQDGNKGKAEFERVLKPETSKQMARMMRLVVSHGTGAKADVPGYRVGGKTGTAEKITAGGGYSKGNNMASFVAAFPVDSPKYVILVMVDEPKGNKATFGFATGGWVAAPVVGRIVARMGPLLGIEPQFGVPGDDAEKYWVSTEKKPAVVAAAPPPVRPAVEKRFLHAVSY